MEVTSKTVINEFHFKCDWLPFPREINWIVFSFHSIEDYFNPTAPKKAKIVYNFGHSECSRIKSIQPPWSRDSVTKLFKNSLPGKDDLPRACIE